MEKNKQQEQKTIPVEVVGRDGLVTGLVGFGFAVVVVVLVLVDDVEPIRHNRH